MNYKNKRVFIIIFFVFLWGVIGYFFYKQNKNIKNGFLSYKNEKQFFPTKNNYDNEKQHFSENSHQKIKNTISDDVLDYIVFSSNLENKEKNNFFEEDELRSCGNFPCFSPEQFIQVYNDFEQETKLNYRNVFIYDGGLADKYLREFAERRFYKQRVFAHNEDIVSFGNLFTRDEVKESFLAMKEEMKKENISLHFVSGYRSVQKQKEIFKNKMGSIDSSKIPKGIYDEKINSVLNRSALPGYSKHHSGYAVDFGCDTNSLVYDFATTKCYEWLSKNNFENAKRFGFIPSYPNAIISQGPDPEPWEFVWVGHNFIKQYFNTHIYKK
jgi:LAS superfamily LD-carboxypeptidase LdcB